MRRMGRIRLMRLMGLIRPLGLIGLLGLGLLGCSKPSAEKMAALAAKGYYTHLAKGEYEQFLEGKAGADSLPADYREQLLTAYQQFMAQQQQLHQGIHEVRTSSVTTDSLAHYTSVMLLLCYGDSTEEEIVVPMVSQNGSWRMK